jgi:hypothetical protein
MSSSPPQGRAFASAGAFIAAISEHIGRALRVRVPVLKAVMELSEREVFAVGQLVRQIRRESALHVEDLELIHRELVDDSKADAARRPTLGQSLRALSGAHQLSLSLSRTVHERMGDHAQLTREAVMSAKQIVDLALDLTRIGWTAEHVTLLARDENAEAGPTGAQLARVAEQLRDLTERVGKAGQQMTHLGHELLRIVPRINEHAAAMLESHAEASTLFNQRMTSLRDAQQAALQTTDAAMREGRERAGRIVNQLYELSARLQFQDSIAQDLTAILHQELASTKLVQRSLGGLPDTLIDKVEFEAEARRAEYLSHALSSEERARRADADAESATGAEGDASALLEEGDDLFF